MRFRPVSILAGVLAASLTDYGWRLVVEPAMRAAEASAHPPAAHARILTDKK